MGYVDFAELSPEQQAEARALRPKWPETEFTRMAFWVKPDGRVSRRAGHHQITEAEGALIDAWLEKEPRSKGGLQDWKTGVTLTFVRN